MMEASLIGPTGWSRFEEKNGMWLRSLEALVEHLFERVAAHRVLTDGIFFFFCPPRKKNTKQRRQKINTPKRNDSFIFREGGGVQVYLK